MREKEANIDALRASLRGELLQPHDEGYDAARKVFNGMIDLSRMRSVRVDPRNCTARAEGDAPGVTLITRHMHSVWRRQGDLSPQPALLVSPWAVVSATLRASTVYLAIT